MTRVFNRCIAFISFHFYVNKPLTPSPGVVATNLLVNADMDKEKVDKVGLTYLQRYL